MPIKTNSKLIECKHTHTGFKEAQVLSPDAQGQKRFKVVLLTEGKGNPRDKHYYSQKCIDDPITAKAFDGKPCFLNHPSLIDDQSQPERRVQDKGGWFSEVHAEGPALWATLTINKRPAGELLECIIQDCMEYSKQFPGQDYDGLSINANGESQSVDMDGATWNQVDRITEAESVDAVTKAARGGRFVAKLEALRKKEVDVEAPKKLKQLGEILKSMRDKIQAGEEFPLQAELRRMADNGLTLAGCGEPEEEEMPTKAQVETMRQIIAEYDKTTKTRESASADNAIARKHTHDTLKGMADQVPDEATKSLLLAHADKYKDGDKDGGDGDGGEGKEAGSGMPGSMPDTTESEKKAKEEKEKKAKEESEKKTKEEKEKKEKMSKEEREKAEEKEKKEALYAENFQLKLEKKLAESGLPEYMWKLIENMSKGKTIEEVDGLIEAQQEVYENTINLRESSMPARQASGNGKQTGKPLLEAFQNV